ncbi:MAG: hypothetical protein ACI4MB_06310 [Candidatus Coproplasma sp.]
MKNKFLALILVALTCVALAFGFTGCSKNNEEVPANGNMLTTVFEVHDLKECPLITHFVKGGAGWTGEKVDGYTVEDLATGKLPYNNYSTINLKWKSSKYKVTKIEFDMIAEKAFETEISINNPRCVDEKNVTLSAGETKHVVFNCNLENNTGLFCIYSGPSDDVKGTISWKWANLYVTAEKI